MNRDNVLIYRDRLLPASETFILSQGEGLSGFRACYLGSRKAQGIEVPAWRSFLVNDGTPFGRGREILFKGLDLLPPRILAQLQALRPALVHAHFGPDGVLGWAVARALRLPLVVTYHGYDATTDDPSLARMSFVERKYLSRRKQFLPSCDRFIAVSGFIKGKLLELGIPERKIVVHYIGVDVDLIRPKVMERKQVVLFVGRLVEKKGCRYLIQAMQRVQEALPEAELVVIGDGPLRGELERLAGATLSSFRFLGAQPNRVVREWMNLCKVFCVPSVTAASGDAEGFGIVFAEAQAMGVPVVSFASGGIPEAVADGETGFLLPEREWQGLAQRITQLFRDAELWDEMSRAARRRVERDFDLKKQCRLLEGIYRQVLAERNHV